MVALTVVLVTTALTALSTFEALRLLAGWGADTADRGPARLTTPDRRGVPGAPRS